MKTLQSARLRQVADLYDSLINLDRTRNSSEHLHVGLFATPDCDIAKGKQRLVDEVVLRLAPTSDDILLDVGCGIGGPAKQISDTYKCRISGITISMLQASVAQNFCGGTCAISVVCGDAHQMPFLDSSHSGALAIESLLHMNRAIALVEIARVLRPGGRFVFCDWYAREKITDRLAAALNEKLLVSAITVSAYLDLMHQSGFCILDTSDWSALAAPTYDVWTGPGSKRVRDNPLRAQLRSSLRQLAPAIRAELGYFCVTARRR